MSQAVLRHNEKETIIVFSDIEEKLDLMAILAKSDTESIDADVRMFDGVDEDKLSAEQNRKIKVRTVK